MAESPLELTLRVARDAARRSPRNTGQRMSPSTLRTYGERIRAALNENPTLTTAELSRMSGGCPHKHVCLIRGRWRKETGRG